MSTLLTRMNTHNHTAKSERREGEEDTEVKWNELNFVSEVNLLAKTDEETFSS